MPAMPLQLRAVLRATVVVAVCTSLGGCLTGPGTTGSINPTVTAETSPEILRKMSDTLGAQFEANPADAGVAMQYAQVLRALGQHAQAVAVLQQAAIRNPRNLPVMGAYGKALVDAGRLKEAAEVLPRAHRPERPDWRILSVQGVVADQMGDFTTAQRFYSGALAIVPGEPSVLSNQGLSFALNGHLPEADGILRQAVANPRADARVRQNFALVLGLEGKFAEAEEVLRRDLPPAEVAANLQSIKRMVSQPNSWKAIRQSDRAPKPAAPNG